MTEQDNDEIFVILSCILDEFRVKVPMSLPVSYWKAVQRSAKNVCIACKGVSIDAEDSVVMICPPKVVAHLEEATEDCELRCKILGMIGGRLALEDKKAESKNRKCYACDGKGYRTGTFLDDLCDSCHYNFSFDETLQACTRCLIIWNKDRFDKEGRCEECRAA